MDIMFSLNQVALLFIQLSGMWHVFAASPPADDCRDMLVSRGGSVEFICNISDRNTTQINWIYGSSFYTHGISLNKTQSNFSSNRVTIDCNLPTKLSIIDAQPEDEGLYECTVTGRHGVNSIKWNLTVSENKEIDRPYLVYILAPSISLLLCGIMLSALCLCRRFRTRTPNQDLDQDQSGGEGGGRTNKRSQYKERLNSIYGHF
ncbi:uncharacterized protein LOC111578116 isoform X2 [Amphiprion ocellaris]|uniref:uncharacterized protein LOC111578116 isoform X2 n=1 Tax=Amphiprion ocellaris TaxID=80972 RepID=UPI0024117B99|nr:uncharacterized protein LOC111578116 isoform X2 [Amphiprion ocellaris]